MSKTIMSRHWQDRSRYLPDGRIRRGKELPKADFERRALAVERMFRAMVAKATGQRPSA